MQARRGQGLLETTIAVGVIAAVAVSVIALMLRSRQGSSAGTSRTQAQFLAEEGIEIMREWCDNNLKNNKTCLAGMNDIQNDGTMVAEFNADALAWTFLFNGADRITDPVAVFRKIGKLWIQGETNVLKPATSFARLITLYPICEDTTSFGVERLGSPGAQCLPSEQLAGMEVVSAVQWIDRSITYNYSVATRIYGWK